MNASVDQMNAKERSRMSTPVAWLLGTLGVAAALAMALAFIYLSTTACALRLPGFNGPWTWPGLACETSAKENDELVALAAKRDALRDTLARMPERTCEAASFAPAPAPALDAMRPGADETAVGNAALDPPILPNTGPDVPQDLAGLQPDNEPGNDAENQPEQPERCSVDPQQANVVIVLDGSGSMKMPQDLPMDVDQDIQLALLREDEEARRRFMTLAESSGPKRIDMARRGLTPLIEQMPVANRRLVTFAGCSNIRSHSGDAVLRQLARFAPDGGTPLASAVERAATMLDRDRDGRIVVVSDGLDSCGGDMCQVANVLSRDRPEVSVDVVDLANWTDVSCLSTRTGGRYLRRENSLDLTELMESAAFETDACGEEGTTQ